MTARLLLAASLLLAPLAAHAQSPQVTVTNPWSRATPPGASTGAAYLTLTSPTADTLTGVSSPAAKCQPTPPPTSPPTPPNRRKTTSSSRPSAASSPQAKNSPSSSRPSPSPPA